ncbi:odorant receptor 4-like [Bombyx mandarina]|uniref:Odorant receptor n=1 Tax=Bombyx mandarina TaxID=7092 RepID=A0A6J2K780_BOMMA|nr:odorant receptor 4-like [Bombyx mandarina]
MSDRMVTRGHFFDFNIKYLFYVGLWPSNEAKRIEKIAYKLYEYQLHVLSLIFLVTTGIGTYKNHKDIIALLTNLDKTLVAYNFVFKVIVFVYKREELRKLIEQIVQSGDQITEDHKAFMAKLVIVLTGISTVIVTAFSCLALFEGEMTIDAWMPFDPMKSKINLFAASQILAATFMVPCGYRAFAMLGIVCSLILYLRDQLVDLQNKIRDLRFATGNVEKLRDDFKLIVKKHVRLLGYSKVIEMIFKEYFFIQNMAVTAELCLNAMMVTVVGLEQKTLAASFLAFLSVALLNAYIYCYLGNELIVQSEGIAMAAYESSWILWPVDMQKDLLIVITAAQKPMKLSAGGIAVLSVQTYSQTLYNGYSIFAVLNDIVN